MESYHLLLCHLKAQEEASGNDRNGPICCIDHYPIIPFVTRFFGDETVTQRKGMLSRTENIGGFHLKVSRQERELYEEFCNSAEAELLREMRDYFIEAKQKAGVINFDRLGMWSKIQNRIDLWLGEACIWRHLNPNQVPRTREAIWHRVKDQLAKTIRETLGAGVESRTT